jgi:enamine deaminase RidA (YjgF/YER057c/UK114 family)
VRGAGIVFTAHGPVQADGSVYTGDIETQARLTFGNLRKAAEAAGATLADVAQVLIYMTEVADMPVIDRVYREFFEPPYPNRSSMGVNALVVPGMKIEIVAYVLGAGRASGSVSARVGAAVGQDVLPRQVGRVGAAQKGADGAELVRSAVAAGRDLGLLAGADGLHALAVFLAAAASVVAMRSVSNLPGSRLLIVTPLAMALRATPATNRSAAARAIAQAQDVDRRLDRARGDVDDAAEAARGHAVDGGLDQLDRREHVGVHRHPGLAVPVAEVAGRRAAGVGDHDVEVDTGPPATANSAARPRPW